MTYYWMAVSADGYELPMAVERTAKELAKKLHVSETAVIKNLDNTGTEVRKRHHDYFIRRVRREGGRYHE